MLNRWPILGRWWRSAGWAALGLILSLAVARSSMAQEAPAAEAAPAAAAPATAASTKPPAKTGLAWFIDAEGIFFYPQLAIGIAVLAMIGINVHATMRNRFVNDQFVADFETLVKNRQFKESFDAAKNQPTMLGKVLSAGLARLTDGYPDAINAIQETGASENMKTEHRLSYLSMLANVATLVGLLGTVWGMVASFMVLAQSDTSPSPSELAKGVSQALVTTIVGLVEAIPAIIAFTILGNLNTRRITDVGMISDQLMRPFKQVAVARKPAAPAPSSVGGTNLAPAPAAAAPTAQPTP